MKPTSKIILIIISGFLNVLLSCSLRRSEPMKGNFVPKDTVVAKGQALFNVHCQKCHPGGEAGLGPDINWNPAPGFIKRFQVRHGLGVMPSFKENEISKKDLHAISKYMKAFKHQKREG